MFRSQEKQERVTCCGAIVPLICLSATLLFLYSIKTETKHINSLSAADNISSQSRQPTEAQFKRLPQAIIIGTRKSGTRALLKFLQLNPAVRVAHRELHFFDKNQNYRQGLDWYKNQMPLSRPNDVTLEKSPAYFVTRAAPERIKAMNSSIKLIVIFRDPVTRLVSDYSQLVANKIDNDDLDEYDADERVVGFNATEAISSERVELAWREAERQFEEYVLRPDGGINEQRRPIRTSMYSLYLERWRSSFPNASQFHYVDGETLVKNPYAELHKLELFLNLKPTIKPNDFVFNTSKGFYCLSGGSSGSESSSECLSKSKGRRHVVVREELLAKLRQFYLPYNEYLYSTTGTDFNWTKYSN